MQLQVHHLLDLQPQSAQGFIHLQHDGGVPGTLPWRRTSGDGLLVHKEEVVESTTSRPLQMAGM